MQIQKYVQREGQRIFIDIARNGCGSGCRYCYVDTAKERQILLEEKEIEEICAYLLDFDDLSDCFLSFCPNTEPLKSRESSSKVLKIIKSVSQFGLAVQISTKERIEPDFISELSELALRKNQFFFNISLPYLTGLDNIEPRAGKLEERLENFRLIADYEAATSCLYIKPFSWMTEKDFQKYVSIIRKHRPDFVCVGAAFHIDNNQIQPCRTYYHAEEATELMADSQIRQMMEFAGKIHRETGVRTVYSTECSISTECGIPCGIEFFRYEPKMCEGCPRRKEGVHEK